MQTFIRYNPDINIVKRLDFNFWSPRKCINASGIVQVKKLKDWIGDHGLATSAFYPAITPFYRHKNEGKNLLPFIRVGDTRKFLLEYKNTVFLDSDLLNELSNTIKRVHPGDIVITKGGEYIGEVSLVPSYYDEYAICRDVLAIYMKACRFSGQYLTSYFQSEHGKTELISTRSVQGQPHLTLEKVYDIQIPYFGTQFEEEIKEYWDSFYVLIEESNKHLVNAMSLLNSFLGNTLRIDDELLVFPKILTLPEISQRIDINYYQERWTNLVDSLKLSGITFENVYLKKGRVDDSNPQKIYKYIKLSDIDDRSGIIKTMSEIPTHSLPDRAKRKISLKDVLVSSLKGSKEKISIVEDDSDNLIASTGFYVIGSRSLEPEVIYAIFRSSYYDLFIEQMASGSIMSSITEKYFKKLKLPIIDNAVQAKIKYEIEDYLNKRAFAFENMEKAAEKFDEELN